MIGRVVALMKVKTEVEANKITVSSGLDDVIVTEPPVTQARTTEPPVTQARTTEPPVTQGRTTEPPVPQARTTEPPTTRCPQVDFISICR